MKPFCSVIALLCMAACTSSKDVSSPTDIAASMKQIQLESSGCYGTCPAFSLTVQRDGTAQYNAQRYNPQQGQFSTTIKKPQMDSLLQLINSTNYFSLSNNYPALVSDVVEYKSSLTLQTGASKTITDKGPGSPASLQALYTFMLSLRTSQDWQ